MQHRITAADDDTYYYFIKGPWFVVTKQLWRTKVLAEPHKLVDEILTCERTTRELP